MSNSVVGGEYEIVSNGQAGARGLAGGNLDHTPESQLVPDRGHLRRREVFRQGSFSAYATHQRSSRTGHE
jgi:hypothetical protein